MLSLAQGNAPRIKRGAVITDVGSVKASVVGELESLVAKTGAHFIGSHPMAGAEKTGVGARLRLVIRQRSLRRHPHETLESGCVAKYRTILESRRRAGHAPFARIT